MQYAKQFTGKVSTENTAQLAVFSIIPGSHGRFS